MQKLCFLNIFGGTPKCIQRLCIQKVLSPVQKMTPDKCFFRDVQWLRYKKSDKNIVHYKSSLKEDLILNKMDSSRRNALCDKPIPKA